MYAFAHIFAFYLHCYSVDRGTERGAVAQQAYTDYSWLSICK